MATLTALGLAAASASALAFAQVPAGATADVPGTPAATPATATTPPVLGHRGDAQVTPESTPSARASATGSMVIAHRGDAQAAPESTVAAVQQAIDKGAHAIEVDVRFTRTGHPMVMHDATLDRTTDCAGLISSYSHVELARCDAGSWFSEAYKGEKIPKLDQVVRAVRWNSSSARILLHVKTLPTTAQAKRVANAVRMHGMMGRTVIIADRDPVLAKMRTVGFTECGRVFGRAAGWASGAEYMLPVGLPLDRAAIRRVHDRGGKVWPVESPAGPLSTILATDSVDGVLVNRLGSVLHLL